VSTAITASPADGHDRTGERRGEERRRRTQGDVRR